nr:hypothetical protein [Tanacetum cinerariifolium]
FPEFLEGFSCQGFWSGAGLGGRLRWLVLLAKTFLGHLIRS